MRFDGCGIPITYWLHLQFYMFIVQKKDSHNLWKTLPFPWIFSINITCGVALLFRVLLITFFFLSVAPPCGDFPLLLVPVTPVQEIWEVNGTGSHGHQCKHWPEFESSLTFSFSAGEISSHYITSYPDSDEWESLQGYRYKNLMGGLWSSPIYPK